MTTPTSKDGQTLYPGEQLIIDLYSNDGGVLFLKASTLTVTNHAESGLLEVSHTKNKAAYLSYFDKLTPAAKPDPKPSPTGPSLKEECLELATWLRNLSMGIRGPIRAAELLEQMAADQPQANT
jgi:hypothetical protein